MNIKEFIEKNKTLTYVMGGFLATAVIITASYFTNASLLQGKLPTGTPSVTCAGSILNATGSSINISWGATWKYKPSNGTLHYYWSSKGKTHDDKNGGQNPFTISYPLSGGSASASVEIHYIQNISGNLTETGVYTATCPKVTFPTSKSTPTVNLTSSKTTSNVNETVTFKATVVTGLSIPTGTITFKDTINGKTAILGTHTLIQSNYGIGTVSVTNLSAGTHSITAEYSGDSLFQKGTSSPLTQTVNDIKTGGSSGGFLQQNPGNLDSSLGTEMEEAIANGSGTPTEKTTTTTLSPASKTIDEGDAVTLTATVVGSDRKSPAGSVAFKEGTNTLKSASLSSGTASYTSSSLSVGTHAITATYDGSDANYKGSTSTSVTIEVQAASTPTPTGTVATSLSLESSSPSSDEGDSVTFTATVTGADNGTPTGMVNFQDDQGVFSVDKTLSSGEVSYTTSNLTAGSYQITATYKGSSSYDESSDSMTQNVDGSSVTDDQTGDQADNSTNDQTGDQTKQTGDTGKAPEDVGQEATLQSPDILDCNLKKTTIARSGEGNLGILCKGKTSSVVNALIMKGPYTGQDITEDLLVKYLVVDQPFSASGTWKLINIPSWNFKDKIDNPVDPGVYTFLVFAQMDAQHQPDISAPKFTVTEFPDAPSNTEQTDQTDQQFSDQEVPTVKPPQPSKCSGVNYPSDIDGHWAKDFIMAGYDLCLLKGYDNGTFHPDEPITRAEAFVMDLNAAGVPPHAGCKDAHCGANYQEKIWKDIKALWQGKYIRAARDAGIASGYPDFTFKPNALVTRAEAAAIISKTKQFNLPPHQGCYTANCGAGYPDHIFQDIFSFWQGQYIRTLAEKQIIVGSSPGVFEPDRPITRAEFAKMIMKARGLR